MNSNDKYDKDRNDRSFFGKIFYLRLLDKPCLKKQFDEMFRNLYPVLLQKILWYIFVIAGSVCGRSVLGARIFVDSCEILKPKAATFLNIPC